MLNKRFYSYIGLVLIVFLGFVLIFVLGKNEKKTDYLNSSNAKGSNVAVNTNILEVDINGTPLSLNLLAPEELRYYDVNTLNTDNINTFSVLTEGDLGDIYINKTLVKNKKNFEFLVDKLEYEHFITLSWKNKTFFIRTRPITLPDFFVNTSSDQKSKDGVYYFTIQSHLVKLNTEGTILYYKKCDYEVNDFRKWVTPSGKTRYTYFLRTPSRSLQEVPYEPSTLIVMDENYTIIDKVKNILGEGINSEYASTPLDSHDAVFIDDGHYLITAYKGKRVDNIPDIIKHSPFGARVVSAVIQEIKDKKLIWEWNSTDYPALYGLSTEGNDYFNSYLKWSDYAHMNSISIDPKDNNIIASFRHLDSIIKIDKKTGNIVWILGGKADNFGLSQEQKFSHQHYAHFTSDNKLLLFNNNNIYPDLISPLEKEKINKSIPERSSIIEASLDEEGKKLLSFDEFYFDDRFSSYLGSVEKTGNKTYAICWGTTAGNGGSLFSEVDFENKKVLFELITDSSITCYRVHKFDN